MDDIVVLDNTRKAINLTFHLTEPDLPSIAITLLTRADSVSITALGSSTISK
jgi:hypothetical protein